LEFDAWADRMGCSDATKEKLRALLREVPEGPRAFFNLRAESEHWTFAIEEAILIARKNAP
jgi:hypothetical protein